LQAVQFTPTTISAFIYFINVSVLVVMMVKRNLQHRVVLFKGALKRDCLGQSSTVAFDPPSSNKVRKREMHPNCEHDS
jgi:hypothetical protein